MKKIRKGDTVILIAGRDKGRKGAVIEVLADDRLRVEGLNMSKKHQKPNPQMGVQGGIVEREAPLHVSNVLIFNPATQKGDRIGLNSLAIGCKVTLRGDRMYEFLDRLVSIAIPRIRDFRGISTRSFDGRGNYSLGVKEQIIFPEIQYDQIDQIRGMDITISTSARDDKHGRALLEAFNFPFRK